MPEKLSLFKLFCPKFRTEIMNKYKHIIWDWNGTLLNDRWLCVEAINQALAIRELKPISEEKYKDVFCFPVETYYEKVGFNFEKEPFQVAGDEFVQFYGDNFHRVNLHVETIPILNKIQNTHRSQSILSAGKQDFLTEWIKEHDLSNYFIKVLGIDNQYATGKTEVGLAWIKELKYDLNEIIMVGDTPHDSDVADAMGIDCVLVENGHVSRKRLEKTGRKVISNLSKFYKLID